MFKYKPKNLILRVLLHPIITAEKHYKKRYHLKFKHAKKLFLFDLGLLFSAFLLLAASIFWFTYDPTITSLIYLNIDPPQSRIQSGEYIDFTVNYKNNSDIAITETIVKLSLPRGFTIQKTDPEKLFDINNNLFRIGDLAAGDSGTLAISGYYFGEPDIEEKIMATLTYQQASKKFQEEKTSAVFSVLRGSVLKTQIESTDKILAQGSVPFIIILENEGEISLENIALPLNLPNGLSLTEITTATGNFEQNQWQISELTPGQKAQLSGAIQSNLSPGVEFLALKIAPEIIIHGHRLEQESVQHVFQIVHPKIDLSTQWQAEPQVQPGKTIPLNISLRNTGNIELEKIILSLPIPTAIINASEIRRLNGGIFTNQTLNFSRPQTLAPGQTLNFALQIPINYTPSGGTDLTFSLTPKITASLKNIPNQTYSTGLTTDSIQIGTQLILSSEARYYTNEGDQLGRGPLPPQVGKETKYWALINISNNTSRVSNLQLSAKLPDYIVWTGKTSVSHGSDIVYDPQTKTISWQLNSLAPHDKTGIFMELSLTPVASQQGSTPVILENIRITGYDSYIGENLTMTSPNLDASLSNDAIAQRKGVIVD